MHLATRCVAVLAATAALAGCGDSGSEISDAGAKRLRATEPVEYVSLRPGIDGTDAYEAAAEVLDARLDARGVLHSIAPLEDRLVVRASGIDDEELDELLRTPGLLALHDWQPVGGTVYRTRDAAVDALGARAEELEDGTLVLVHGSPDQMPGNGVVLAEGRGFDPSVGAFATLENEPGLTDEDVLGAVAEQTPDDEWVVAIGLTPSGQRRFLEATRELARRGALEGTPQRFAIVVGDEVATIPQIDYREYPAGIRSEAIQIAGLDDRAEARRLAAQIDAGPLPFELVRRGED